MKYAFVEENRSKWPVRSICKVLSVSPSAFYDWRSEQRRKRNEREYQLLRTVEKVFQGSDESYGSPRMWRHIRALGFKVSKAKIERVMRVNGMRAKKRRKFVSTTDSKHSLPIASNVLNRQFDQGAIDRVWLSDITYISTQAGWAYLATVMDAHSRKIIGWSLSDSLESKLVVEAMKSAIRLRGRPVGVIVHSDRGSQYASHEYVDLIRKAGFVQSMSRKGNCWDNAPMESFFDSLKTEYVHHARFAHLQEAYQGLFYWIEIRYNRQRMHSSLGYRSPACFEDETMALAA